MSELSNFKNTQEIIKKHNFSIQKKYGQNFLIDEHVLNKIIAAAELTEDDYVIENRPFGRTQLPRIRETGDGAAESERMARR